MYVFTKFSFYTRVMIGVWTSIRHTLLRGIHPIRRGREYSNVLDAVFDDYFFEMHSRVSEDDAGSIQKKIKKIGAWKIDLMDCIQSHGESFVLLLGYSGVDSY
jgi:hypothetical protein